MANDNSVLALGDVEIDRTALGVAGRSLAEAVAEVTRADAVRWVLTQDQALRVPARGWRPVHTQPTQVLPVGDGYTVHALVRLAAPHPTQPGTWVLARVQAQPDGTWVVALDDQPHRPGPSRAVRRAGLLLRWPDTPLEIAAGTVPELTVELVNTTDQPWSVSTKDHASVDGKVQQPGSTEDPTYGWFAYTPLNLVPNLAPGEVAVLPVTFSARAVRPLPPGPYEMTAVLSSLGLRTTTRALRVT